MLQTKPRVEPIAQAYWKMWLSALTDLNPTGSWLPVKHESTRCVAPQGHAKQVQLNWGQKQMNIQFFPVEKVIKTSVSFNVFCSHIVLAMNIKLWVKTLG